MSERIDDSTHEDYRWTDHEREVHYNNEAANSQHDTAGGDNNATDNNGGYFWKENPDGSIQITEHKRIVDSGIPKPIRAFGTAMAGMLTNNLAKPLIDISPKLGPYGKATYAAGLGASAAATAFTGLNYKVEDERGDTAALSAPDYPNGNRGE